MKVAAQAILPVGPEEAWRALTDWEGQPRWMTDAQWVRVLTGHREGVGVVVAVRNRVLGVPLFTERLEVTLWDPPRRLIVAHRSFVRGVGTWTLTPVERGTAFRWTEELSLPVPFLGELALEAYRPVMRRLMAGSIARLQASKRRPST